LGGIFLLRECLRKAGCLREGFSHVLTWIGPTPAKLFIAQGQNHGFDGALFLGDPRLTVVEEAWAALDDIVKAKS
jgi:hypothetical protein